jgi:hypothetical protein
MTDEKLWELVKRVHPHAVRVPPGIKATLVAPTQGADVRPVAIIDSAIEAVADFLEEKANLGIISQFTAIQEWIDARDATPVVDAPIDEQAMFESWCVSKGWLRINLERNPASGYADPDIDDMWDGWSARAHIAASAPKAVK